VDVTYRRLETMRNVSRTLGVLVVLLLGVCSSAQGFEGGGRSPSAAPTLLAGQHYTGQLNNHKNDANYNGSTEVAFWRLPPLSTRDVITIDWHGAPYTRSPGSYPLCMTLAQGIDDFNWGSVFAQRDYCDSSGPFYELSGSGTAHTEIVAQESTTNTSYLEFYVSAYETEPADYETYPYDFTLGPILHYLAVAMRPVQRVSATGIIRATATLATGQPAPDGLPFSLAVSWPDGGVASYTGVSSGGVVSFQLALPETAYGKNARFVVSHPADSTYQGVEAEGLTVKVAKPKPPPPSPCELAETRALVLKRQYKRLRSHARIATGMKKRRLSRRAKRAKRKLMAARREVQVLCG
jgi:hypothetical protein